MLRLSTAVLVTALFFCSNIAAQNSTDSSSTAAAGFVSSDKYFSFALNIPQDEDDSLYFTIQGTDTSWIGVGLGNDHMAHTLIFMVYADSSGKNVTVSPRLSHGNVEPSYTSNITLEVLAGSGIFNGTMKANARCGNCRSWPGGSIDPIAQAAKFIFASGPGGSLQSNSRSADVKRHAYYGSFTMDLTTAVGQPNVPDEVEWNSPGSAQLSNVGDVRNFAGAAHACLMVATFVGLLPLGVLILRVFKSGKWHGVTQAVSMLVALSGMAIGIWMGMKYNRTKNFNSPHQIIGIIVITAMVGQFVLGVLHHRMYKKTQAPTKISPIHIWLGRFVIVLGIVNGFIGFPLALNPKYDLALLAVLLFVVILIGPLAFWRFRRDVKKAKTAGTGEGASLSDEGYNAQPWVSQPQGQGQATADIQLGQMRYPPPYQGRPATQGRQFV